MITFPCIFCLPFFLVFTTGEISVLKTVLEKVVQVTEEELHCSEIIIMCANSQIEDITFGKSAILYSLAEFYINDSFEFTFINERNRSAFIYILEENENVGSIFEKITFLETKVSGFWKMHFILLWPTLIQNELEMENSLKSIPFHKFLLNSNFYTVFYQQSDRIFFWELYWLKEMKIFRKVVSIENKNVSINNSKLSRREDFMGLQFVATTFNDTSYELWVKVKPTENGTVQFESGFSVQIFNDFMKMLNFTEKVVIGDWVGSLTASQLNKEEADLSVIQASITEFRAKELSFLQPTYYSLIKAFFTQPDSSTLHNVISAPFQTSLWVALLITWILTIITLKTFSFIKWKFHQLHCVDENFGSEATMWAIAATCQKSWHTSPFSFSTKSVFLIGYICGLVTFVAYSAAIVSSLAITIIPIHTVSDLLRFGYVMTVHNESRPMKDFLKGLIDRYSLRQKIETTDTVSEVEHFIGRPKAFLSFPDIFYSTAYSLKYDEKFLCSHVSVITVNPVPLGSGMFMKKGSPYVEMFSHKIMMLKERGLNRKYMKDYDNRNGVICNVDRGGRTTKLDPVKNHDVFTAYIIILGGLVSSLGLLIFEFLFCHSSPNDMGHHIYA